MMALFWVQAIGAAIALRRLSRWRDLPAPLTPAQFDRESLGVTIVIPTLNEARRITPLLQALKAQKADEILFVDSRSTDGTQALIEMAAADDPRIRLVVDDELPAGWIGKAWALECGRRLVRTPWVLMLDADTAPRAGLTDAIVTAAEAESLDAVSLAPRFAGQSAAERFMQPSLLISLLYRFAPASGNRQRRVLANGQCFLVKRDVLERAGGFSPVRHSFAEDVSLAAHLIRSNAAVAFRDGAHLYDVRSYESAAQMWKEWGRSIDLKDASTRAEQTVDVLSALAVQGMPLVAIVLAILGVMSPASPLAILSYVLFAIRFTLLLVIRHGYAQRGVSFWLSPLSDPLAALRLLISSLRRPTSWRGRIYHPADRR